MSQLRAIIIDDDRTRRESIRDMLPDYFSCVAVGYTDGALDYLKPDADGVVADIVIMYGDDSKSLGLYTYDWMINKSGNVDVANIPVVILTEDEFSDRSIEFLEIGDVLFYEGEIEESRLFSVITDAIEAAEFAPEPVVTGYEETKSVDRLAGMSVKAPDEDGKQRAVVLDVDTQMDNLMAALERGKKRASDIRTLLDAAKKVKKDRREFNEEISKPSRKPESKQESYHESYRESDPESPVERLKQKAMSNPFGALGAQGTIKLDEPARKKQNATYEKKCVVIVDGDVKTRKLCSLYLMQNFKVVVLDSGIKAIDFFVKNHADLLIINPVLSGMNGTTTVNSIHMQPGCGDIPVMYLVGDDYNAPRSRLLGPHVMGILNKPIKREIIAQAVEGLFGNRPDA